MAGKNYDTQPLFCLMEAYPRNEKLLLAEARRSFWVTNGARTHDPQNHNLML